MYQRLRDTGATRVPVITESPSDAPEVPARRLGRARVTAKSLERQRAKGNVAIIGGGIGGATCALRLAQQGRRVVLLEASPMLGGLVTSFQVAGTPLECFYHHIFPNEADIIGLIDELGLGPKLTWLPSSTGIYTGGKVWPFTTPKDLLTFAPLAFKDRLHAGIGALRLTRVRDWESLDELPAQQWLRNYCGEAAAELVWRPLLAQKFGPAAPNVPATWMWGRLQQRNGARGKEADQNSGEKLGYLRGGFAQMFDQLHKRLVELGVDVRTSSPVKTIELTESSPPAVRGVTTSDGTFIDADEVVFAGTIPRLPGLLPEALQDKRWTDARGLGAQCVILELRRRLQDQYWVNVCDEGLPFGGIIEHTNFVPPEDYDGRRIVYLSRYFTAEESVATSDPDEEGRRWVDLLLARFPQFDPADVLDVHSFRTPYAAPLVHLGYKAAIPPIKSDIAGLWVATTAQIYPQDRGMNEGVRLGTLVATNLLADRSKRPLADPPGDPVSEPSADS
jgi:protoporphyrinogen oxidase